jgi:thiol:disulfide interchange protein
MKNLSLVAVVLFIFTTSFVGAPTGENESGVHFRDLSFSEAIKAAEKEGKIVFLDAYASWCGPCKWMEGHTFQSEKVGTVFNEHFVSIKIDMEKGEGPKLAQKYQVRAYPTMFLINPKNGSVNKRILGMQREQAMLDAVKEFTE